MIYQKVRPSPIDPQIIMQCEKGAHVPLHVLLAQYKYLVLHGEKNYGYKCIRDKLIADFGKQTIEDMEAIQ